MAKAGVVFRGGRSRPEIEKGTRLRKAQKEEGRRGGGSHSVGPISLLLRAKKSTGLGGHFCLLFSLLRAVSGGAVKRRV